ncbi:MAG: HDOD domain-containing protein [Holophagales bacterium]|jgi:HD-like signal output (HDOD) protein|nr:HDOD domain-containing protein [Holophagales bacterium]
MPITPHELVADLGSLPQIPHIASQVLRLTVDPDCSVSELQRLIASDQALAAQILKIANSAMFGMVREVRTLSQAITTLGLNTVKSVVIASSAKNLYRHNSAVFHQMAIWEHSVVTALAGSVLARIFHFPAQDEVFLGGLIHDVGKSVIAMKYPNRYREIINSIYNGETGDGLKAELDAFGFDHTMVGEALLDSWNIPRLLSHCVRWHHCPGNADLENALLTAYIALGNLFAYEVGENIGKPDNFAEIKKDALRIIGISEVNLDSQKEIILDCLEQDKVFIMGF